VDYKTKEVMMFNLFKKPNKGVIKPFNKDKDAYSEGYQKCIQLLAKSHMNWLLKSKLNASISLCSLDFQMEGHGIKDSHRFKAMLDRMDELEYQAWIRDYVFH
jgi:hypothetical protein